MRGNPSPAMILSALATGLSIAAYSLVDGLGARLSGSPMGYIAWLFVLEIFVTGFIFLRRGRAMLYLGQRAFAYGLVGGLISAGAYGLAIYAKTLAPLGVVSALRETSVLIAAVIGVVLLGERPWRLRVLAAIVVVGGIILIASR